MVVVNIDCEIHKGGHIMTNNSKSGSECGCLRHRFHKYKFLPIKITRKPKSFRTQMTSYKDTEVSVSSKSHNDG